MKDLILCVLVVVKTLNLEILRYYLAEYIKELYCMPHVQHYYFSLFNQPNHWLVALSLAMPSWLVKADLWHRQRERHKLRLSLVECPKTSVQHALQNNPSPSSAKQQREITTFAIMMTTCAYNWISSSRYIWSCGAHTSLVLASYSKILEWAKKVG